MAYKAKENALLYARQGFSPIPVEYRGKACRIDGWPNLRINEQDVAKYFNDEPKNVGVILGDASNGLIDIDLDCAEAIKLAPLMLPSTRMIFGRESKSASHWLYKVPNPGKSVRLIHPDEPRTLVEVRANGCMTVFPGSLHESAEEIRFDQDGVPAEADFDQLVSTAQHLAAASLLLSRWTKGQRHYLALSLAGTMLKVGYGAENVTVPQSDVANAERFSTRHGSKARYIPQLKKWLLWDGLRWFTDDGGRVRQLAMAIGKEIALEEAERGHGGDLKWAAKVNDLRRLRDMVTLAQSHCEATLNDFDADPWKLNCRSGIIDLQSGQLMPHRAEALMRRLAPVSFHAETECPNFMAFLERIFARDAELIAFIQRAIGYTLTGKTDEQCLFVLIGSGANGKSTLIRLWHELLGDYGQQTPMDTLMVSRSGGINNDVARLEGARFVSASEAEASQRLAEAKIKELTGGDGLRLVSCTGNISSSRPNLSSGWPRINFLRCGEQTRVSGVGFGSSPST